jgi:hypothetical protein
MAIDARSVLFTTEATNLQGVGKFRDIRLLLAAMRTRGAYGQGRETTRMTPSGPHRFSCSATLVRDLFSLTSEAEGQFGPLYAQSQFTSFDFENQLEFNRHAKG